MTTFQAMIYGAVQGFSEFLPISSSAHRILVSYILGWEEPSGTFLGALSLGSLLSLLVYFRHDWASMLSCFIQCILFRKKPMTLDERLPLFILLATLPLAIVWFYFEPMILDLDWTPLTVAVSFGASAALLWLVDLRNRSTKGMFDWSWSEAIYVGFANVMMILPGVGHLSSSLLGAYSRNFKSEASTKFAFYCLMPVLAFSTYIHLHGAHLHFSEPPSPSMSWLSWVGGAAVSFLASLAALDAFVKQSLRNGVGQYMIYRILLAVSVGGVYWFRNR